MARIEVTGDIALDDREIIESFIRSSGPGGQNVNKVATAVQLRFDIVRSPNLSEAVKARLSRLGGARVTRRGVLVLKAERFRTLERNRQDALDRLVRLIKRATEVRKPRRPTRPTMASRERRLVGKTLRSATKRRRDRPPIEE